MWEFQQKKSTRKIVYSWWSLLIIMLLCGGMIKAAWGVRSKELLSRERLIATEREYEKLIERERLLSQSITTLTTDEGIEAEIRKKYRVVKDGENIAVIVDDEVATVSVATSTPGFFMRLIKWFKQ